MGYKGFNPGLICRGKQYTVGTLFEEDEKSLCECGMHYCENVLDCFEHYPLINAECEHNAFASVFSTERPASRDGKKFCTTALFVEKVLSLREIALSAIQLNIESSLRRSNTDVTHLNSYKTGAQLVSDRCGAQISSSGNYAKMCGIGRNSRYVGSGDNDTYISIGEKSNVSAAGDVAYISCEGNESKISGSGNYPKVISEGESSRIALAGDFAAASSGGNNSVIVCLGAESKARGKKGSWITLAEWDCKGGTPVPVCVKTEQIDGIKIKENVFYTLRNGEFVEAGKEK